MRHYNVAGICDRRVNPDDGVVEYCVQWEGYDSLCNTWEPRCNLVACCAGSVDEVDAREGEMALRHIEAWARSCHGAMKRTRDEDPEEGAPSRHCIILHNDGGHDDSAGDGDALLVALGERVLTDATSRGLNPTKKKKQQGQQEHEPICDHALLLEKKWREQHAVSFMHTCTNAVRRTPAAQQFELGGGSDACHDASSIEIHGIAPAALVKSGQVYSAVTSCVPLIGREEAERLRSQCNFNSTLAHTTQELVRGRRDQLVVRYFLTDSDGSGDDGHNRKLYTMPLSLFRRYYPQLLLDFLLRHALVMESQ